jgi:lactate dehydrogenase-like 2-hydroxyacid dehydrogenase
LAQATAFRRFFQHHKACKELIENHVGTAKAVRTGQQEHGRKYSIAGAGKLGQNIKNRIGGTGQDSRNITLRNRTVGTGQRERTVRIVQAGQEIEEQDVNNMTARKGTLGYDIRDRTVVIGQP